MRIALVHDWLDTPGGGELVLARLMQLYPQADLFTLVDFLTDTQRLELGLRSTRTTALQRWPGARRWFRAAAVLYPAMIERIDVSGYDLVISDSHALSKGVRTHPGQVHVCYCHTPPRFAWDMADIYERSGPLRFGLARRLANPALVRFRKWDVRRAQDVDYYVANSRHVAGLIRRCYDRDATVIYPPVDIDRFVPRHRTSVQRGTHYVTLTRLVAYKRIDLMLDAFAQMPDRVLRIIGDGPEWRRLKERAPANVRMLGRLSDREASPHITSARAFLQMAKEDFGIATVEAQGAGIPVIGHGVGGTREIIRDASTDAPTGVLFDEQSAGALIDAIERFEQRGQGITGSACRANATRFTGEHFDAQFRQLIGAVTGESPMEPVTAGIP